MTTTGLAAKVKYIKRQSPTGHEVYFLNPIWLSLYRPDGSGFEWMKEEDNSDSKADAIKMIKKKGGIIFEEILDKGKTNLKKLSGKRYVYWLRFIMLYQRSRVYVDNFVDRRAASS